LWPTHFSGRWVTPTENVRNYDGRGENVIESCFAEKAVKKHYGIPDWEPPKQAGKTA
jgi:hypothetical protein